VPPFPAQLPLYATPTCAFAGNEQVKVNAAAATVKFVTACVALCAVGIVLSTTFTVNEYVLPAVVGVPVIAPVLVFKLNPPGNVPALIEYV
jgi:hypothetical protein